MSPRFAGCLSACVGSKDPPARIFVNVPALRHRDRLHRGGLARSRQQRKNGLLAVFSAAVVAVCASSSAHLERARSLQLARLRRSISRIGQLGLRWAKATALFISTMPAIAADPV